MSKSTQTNPLKKRTTRRPAKSSVVEEQELTEEFSIPQVDELLSSSLSPTDDLSDSPLPTSTRTKLVREQVLNQFSQLHQDLEEQIRLLSEDKTHKVDSRTLKKLLKDSDRIKTSSSKLMRDKKPRNENSVSGFKKPVRVSKEMAKFAGWAPGELKSRVDATNAICTYIKAQGLQYPEDKRFILLDKKLAKLLRCEQNTVEEIVEYKEYKAFIKENGENSREAPAVRPVTYPSLQTYIQQHFKKSSD
jgi:chromatin remodeling complex protein RSC6